jgi:hypothetical protein
VKVAVVMPGHIGTSIVLNTNKVLGKASMLEMPKEELDKIRLQLMKRRIPIGEMSDEQLRAVMHQLAVNFRDNAPMTAAQAATVILDGVHHDRWRILVGEDAKALDRMVRETPEDAYEETFTQALQAQGHMRPF